MRIYTDIGAYLRNEPLPLTSREITLSGNNRPILVLDNNERLLGASKLLIPLENGIYELGFPFVTLANWDFHKNLISPVPLILQRDHEQITDLIQLQDHVLDATQINDENIQNRLTQELSDQYDRHTADTIAVLVGLFYGMRSQERAKKVDFPLLSLPNCLQELSRDEARQPLVVSLDRRYELRHKLETITPKLRSQLNRIAEMMSLARIQEMDAYCLRDYVRRPGRDAVEKAGARQELLGIKRFQNFNTPENKFLKGFCELLHFECQQYSYHYEAKLLGQTIDYFRQDPMVQTIQKSISLLDKPNYVLEQNAIYRSFYQAYLDFVHRLSDKEKLWSVRRRLASDAIAVLLTASFLNLQGSYADSLDKLTILDTPQYGHYLEGDCLPIVRCFLATNVVSFQLRRSSKIGDWLLLVKKQEFNSSETKPWKIPIWVFWYRPTTEILENISNDELCFYLYELPNQTPVIESLTERNNLHVFQLPDLVENSWKNAVEFLTNKIQNYIGGLIL